MENHPSDPKFHIQTYVTVNHNEVSQTLLIRLPWAYSDMGSRHSWDILGWHTYYITMADLPVYILRLSFHRRHRVRLVETFFLSNRSRFYMNETMSWYSFCYFIRLFQWNIISTKRLTTHIMSAHNTNTTGHYINMTCIRGRPETGHCSAGLIALRAGLFRSVSQPECRMSSAITSCVRRASPRITCHVTPATSARITGGRG